MVSISAADHLHNVRTHHAPACLPRTASMLVVLSVFCLSLLALLQHSLISRAYEGTIGSILDLDSAKTTATTTTSYNRVGGGDGGGFQQQARPSSHQRSLNIKDRRHSSPVRFVFAVGLEGTAHHLLRKILKRSPAMEAVNQLDLRKTLRELQDALYTGRGLFNLHCGIKVGKKGPDVEKTHQYVVGKLREISDAVGNSTSAIDKPLSIALNAFGGHFQMASYPQVDNLSKIVMIIFHVRRHSLFALSLSNAQDNDACRMLKYPSLDLLYSACEDAGVDCAHVYLFRDPYAIIKSTTTNRHFNENVLQGIHLYISMLHIVYGQLSRHASRTIGCFGFLEPSVTNEEVWDPIKGIFGWKDHEKYTKYIGQVYKPPPHVLSNGEQAAIIPENYRVYTNSLVSAHKDVIELCQSQFAENALAQSSSSVETA